ncbi:MAG: hypothetical protein GXP16_03365 [Gammaproteobacteria bacterium]|nr:hypothetical protein [Gammaproteobacteria bacterium]
MSIKLLSVSILACVSTLGVSTASYACDATKHSSLEREKISLSTLNSNNTQVTLYNFRSGQCLPLNMARNTDLDISAFLPSDETSLGMYQLYRNQGNNRIDALKHTLEFIIDEQQS